MLAQNLVLAVRFAPGTGQRDSILGQAPTEGALVAPGDTVIVCSYERVRVPNVMGAAATLAQRAMNDSGFSSVVTTIPLKTTEGAGTVRRQNPEANSVASPGSTVTLSIGVAPPPPVYRMPNVSGTYLAAQDSLIKLRARTEYALPVSPKFLDSAPPPGLLVEGQQPPPDAVINARTTVLLTLRDTTTRLFMKNVKGDYLTALQTLSQLRWPNGRQVPFTTNGDPDVMSRRNRFVVSAQVPSADTELTPSSTVMLTLRDTTTLPPMPDLTGRLSAANNSLTRLRTATGFPLTTSTNPMPGVPPERLEVFAQQPAPRTTLTSSSAIALTLRDAAPPQFPMPQVVGAPLAAAMDSIVALRRVSGFGLVVRTTVGKGTRPGDSLVVDTQSPTARTLLSADTAVAFVLRLAPPRQVVIMPDVVGRTVRSARDTLSVLGISFFATAKDRADSAGDTWIIARQTPDAGDTVTAATPVHLYASAPFPWIPVAAGAGAAAAAIAYNRLGKWRVGRMAVAARTDPIPPRVKLQMRGGETADEAFSRIGVSFTPVARRGTATLTKVRLPQPYNRDHDG